MCVCVSVIFLEFLNPCCFSCIVVLDGLCLGLEWQGFFSSKKTMGFSIFFSPLLSLGSVVVQLSGNMGKKITKCSSVSWWPGSQQNFTCSHVYLAGAHCMISQTDAMRYLACFTSWWLGLSIVHSWGKDFRAFHTDLLLIWQPLLDISKGSCQLKKQGYILDCELSISWWHLEKTF